MDNSTLVQLIIDRLNEYFANENMRKSGVTEEVAQVLLSSVDCDTEELILALNRFCSLKKDTDSPIYSYTGESIDISHPDMGEIFVKAFITENHSRLHFFRGEEKVPFFKLRLSLSGEEREVILESSSDSKIFANHDLVSRASKEENNGLFVVQNKYYIDDSGMVRSSKNFMKNGVRSESEPLISMDGIDEKYLSFYKLVSLVRAYNKRPVSDQLSETECELLFAQFFDKIDSFLTYENEFKFDQLLTIINNFMYNKNYGNASISGKNNLEETASWINRCAEIECVGRTGENLKVEVSKIDGIQLTIVVKKQVGDGFEDVCSYMIWNTGEGFTLYRRILDKNSAEIDSGNSSLLFNVSADEIRFSLLGDYMKKVAASALKDRYLSFVQNGPVTINIKITPSGQLEYDSNEVTFSEQQQAFEKPNKEVKVFA